MKLALVRQTYTPFGGAERFVDRALGALRAQGLAVTLVARRWKGSVGDVRVCNPFYLGRTWRDWGFARAVQRLVASGEFDLVQSHERIPGCHLYRAGDGVHATWLELRGRDQSFLARSVTRWQPWHRYTLAAEAALFRHPQLRAVICNSRMVRDDIARRFGVPEEKLPICYNGVDLEIFHPRLAGQHRLPLRAAHDIPPTAPMLLYVGSGFERKGVPRLLKAFARWHGKAWLVIVGSDRRLSAMVALTERLKIADRVRFVGRQEDVAPWYGAADGFVLPTLYDPFPNAALEALASGLPVITTTSCGAAEFIREDDNGWVVDPLDEAGLADRLARWHAAWADPERRDRMRAAARRSAEGCPLDAMAARLTALYQSILGR